MIYRLLMNTLKWIPDEPYLQLVYFIKKREFINLKDPKSFNEKLHWLKLNDRKDYYTKLVDKYEVRNYIEEKIGKEYLIPLIGVWKKFDDINFDKLPNKFVLKCTHCSGGVIICTDKSKFDFSFARRKLNKILSKNYFYYYREWPYKNVEPKIICEKYMIDDDEKELKDYKILCFNGEPKLIQVDYERFTNHKRNYYDINWKLTDLQRIVPNNSIIENKPEQLNEMLDIAKVLSKGFIFIRIDLYLINSKVYFGELTFFPGSGYTDNKPEEYDIKLGNWIKLEKF